MHETPLIETLVVGLVLAYLLGSLAQRVRVSPLVGYLIAGWFVGPYSPGFVADQHIASELAELGVILLMFGVGLHFSVRDLLAVRRLAVPGALLQIAAATAMGMLLGWALGWNLGSGLLFGLALSVASTVVLLRALQQARILDSERGRIAIGWLIVEDLVMVLALVLIPALAPVLRSGSLSDIQLDLALAGTLLLTIAKVAAFIAVMFIAGRRLIPWTLQQAAGSGSRELFRLSVLAIAMGVALGAAVLFGVSFALGAFFAGVILAESELSSEAAEETLPLRDAFAVLFFVAAGMLFNPAVIWQQPVAVILTILIVIVGKSVVAYFLVRTFAHDHQTAMTIAISLAQTGEFSFILVNLGGQLEILSTTGRDLVVAAAIVSICLNPMLFTWLGNRGLLDSARELAEPIESEAVPETIPPPAGGGRRTRTTGTDTGGSPVITQGSSAVAGPLTDHVVLIGYGRVGSRIGAALRQAGERFVVIEDRNTPAKAARADGARLIYGNCTDEEVLGAANVTAARQLVVAIPQGLVSGEAIRTARRLGCTAPIVARADTAKEAAYLAEVGADRTVLGETELARGMLEAAHESAAAALAAAKDTSPEHPQADLPSAQEVLVPLSTDPAAVTLAAAISATGDAPFPPASPPTGQATPPPPAPQSDPNSQAELEQP
ncbi:MAG: cation:proton antiporter [Candidatus Nanopelagicales bacterium]